MKKSVIALLAAILAFIVCLTSCIGSQQNKDEAAKNEEEAVIAGSVPKNLLTEELKAETIQFLKDMPDSDIPNRIYSGEVSVSVGNLSYMLPVSKASELNTMAQKARACGMYFADYNVLKATKQPTSELESVLVKLTTDLNVSFIQNILKEEVPANATNDEFAAFLSNQQNRLIDAMADNDKIDVQVEMLGGMAAEYACLVANPSLVVKGDATSAGLSENMERRLDMLGEIASELSVYYPDLKELGSTIIPLKDKVTSIQTARSSQDEIMAIRNNLLK